MSFPRISLWAERLLLPAAFLFVGYQMVTVWLTLHGAIEHYLIHIIGVLMIVSLLTIVRAGKEGGRRGKVYIFLALAAATAALVTGLNFYLRVEELEFTQPFIGNRDLIMGTVLVISVLVLTGMTWGWTLAGICAAAALYFAYGHLLPSAIAPTEQPFNVVVSFLAGIGGPRGVLTYIPLSANMIFLLLVYGGVLHGCRVIEMFEEVGKAIGNLMRGGVAFSAVAASVLIGMVTGQAVSNIALSGIMTIPTMNRSGFTKEQAGAVEVLASTGSQLLPPIMGLGAFLMAVILGVSYIEVVIAAFIPGLLYVAAVGIGIAALIGSSRDIPHFRQEVDWAMVRAIVPSFLVSFLVVIVLLALRYSPSLAGFWGIIVLGAMSLLRPKAFRPRLGKLLDGFREGVSTAVQLALVLASIGVVVQTLTTTGAGVSLGAVVAQASSGNVVIGLLIGMLVSLFIGMGLPTPAAYALIAIVVVPSLVDLGLSPLAANMFGFYFAIFSTLTPPVAVGILTAVRISGGSFMGTVTECVKLGAVCFLVPYLFVAIHGILEVREFGLGSLVGIIAFLAATVMLAGALYGHLRGALSVPLRLASGVIGVGALIAYLVTETLVVGLIAPAVLALLMFANGRGVRQQTT